MQRFSWLFFEVVWLAATGKDVSKLIWQGGQQGCVLGWLTSIVKKNPVNKNQGSEPIH
jgi:hypothetical protein